MVIKAIVPLLLFLVGSVVGDCPTCDAWTGVVGDVCGLDGVTYASDCELVLALCKDGTITFGSGTDINSVPVPQIAQQYKSHDGSCNNDDSGGNCPTCTTVVDPIPVCDSSLAEFNSSCTMAKKMCAEGVISFDDGANFTIYSEADYRSKVASFVNWEGKCSGPCPAGQYSRTGDYGPCKLCGPGTYAANSGSDTCTPCPRDFYQDATGASACISCPNGTDTLDTGSSSVSQCVEDCVAGHYSTTGKAPCTPCPTGYFTNTTGSTSCQSCPVGSFSATGASCDECPMGSYSAQANVSACNACGVGTYSNVTGALACSPCQLGTYADTTGLDSCIVCGEGTYGNSTGATSCSPCTPGHYQIEPAKTFCYPCNSGTYQPNSGERKCVECGKGTYQESEGAVTCSSCPDGTTTESTGSLSRQECVYTSCEPGSKVKVVGGHLTCEPCPAGSYQDNFNQTSCKTCPWDTYQDTEGSRMCTQCPENHVTYNEGGSGMGDCEGPQITLSTSTSHYGYSLTLYDKRIRLPGNFAGKVRSFKVDRGDWYIFSGDRYGGRRITLTQGVERSDVNDARQYPKIDNLSSGSFFGIRPVVTNVMCYTETGKFYTGYRSKTQRGVTCQNWNSNFPHKNLNKYSKEGIGNHNYCRNPDNDANGPWCYTTDPARRFDYCGVPKCKWNVECYTERGQLYRGTRTKTAGNRYNCNNWYSNWPHVHYYDDDANKKYGIDRHSYCRNPSPGDDNRPWCYTTKWYKRWTYCDVPKCEFSSIDYFERKHHPKSVSGTD